MKFEQVAGFVVSMVLARFAYDLLLAQLTGGGPLGTLANGRPASAGG